MKRTYSNLNHDWWHDPAVRDLSPAAKAMFVWSFTNSPCASLTGFTQASHRKLATALWPDAQPSFDALRAVLDELAEKPLVLYDDVSEVLWCPKRSAHALRSAKQLRAAIACVAQLPPCAFVTAWAEKYALGEWAPPPL